MTVVQSLLDSPQLDLTKRALRGSAIAQGFWVGLAGVIVVLVISGPFTTSDIMSVSERAIYWFVIATCTYFFTISCAAPVYVLLHPRIMDWRVNSVISGLFAALPVTAFVVFTNTYVFKVGYGNLDGYAELAFGCVIITIVGTFLHQAVNVDLRQIRPAPSPDTGAASPLLKKLDPEIRANVVSLHAQGHYVEVTTLRGRQLLLMRLKDAIAELEPDSGCQVHRSWWVSKQVAQAAKRCSGRVVLNLADGREVPVSRFNLTEIRRWIASETADP